MKRAAAFLLLTAFGNIKATPVTTKSDAFDWTNNTPKTNENLGICSKVIYNNGVYSYTDLWKQVQGIPADIKVQWSTDDVFYTLISNEMKMSLYVLHKNGDINHINVTGLGQSTAVDNLNDIVYLATDNGIYKYKTDGWPEFYTAKGEDVMYMALNNDSVMFIATWPQNRVHKINKNNSQESFSAVTNGHGLTIDSKNNIFFVDIVTEILYVLKNGDTVPIKIKGLNMGKRVNVFMSKSNIVYAMDENSNFYNIDVDNEMAKYLTNFHITGINSFAMDSSSNLLVGVNGAISKIFTYKTNPCNVSRRLKYVL